MCKEPFVKILFVSLLLITSLAACGQGAGDAIQDHYTLGLITNTNNGAKNVQGFIDGMATLGYAEGDNVTYVWAGGPTDKTELEIELQEMVDQQVDLIFTAGTPTGVAAYNVTKDTEIPVIFGVIADPVVAGVMTNLSVPGGNMTGVMLSQNQTRRLEILLEIVPDAKLILFPYNPEDAAPVSAMMQLMPMAREMNIEVIEYLASSDEDVDALFNSFPDVDAVFMLPDSTVNPRIVELIKITNKKGIPVSGPSTAQVEDGALICYGIVHSLVGGHAAQIAHRVLVGGNPAEIPVETAEFYIAVNMDSADLLGIEIPYALLEQAEIIVQGQ